MPLIQRTGIEPSLPQVAAPAMKTVDILRIAKVRSADSFGQRILLVRKKLGTATYFFTLFLEIYRLTTQVPAKRSCRPRLGTITA